MESKYSLQDKLKTVLNSSVWEKSTKDKRNPHMISPRAYELQYQYQPLGNLSALDQKQMTVTFQYHQPEW
jgi:hypothetical protein